MNAPNVLVEGRGRWEDFRGVVTGGREVALAIRACPKPVIAAFLEKRTPKFEGR